MYLCIVVDKLQLCYYIEGIGAEVRIQPNSSFALEKVPFSFFFHLPFLTVYDQQFQRAEGKKRAEG